MIISKGGDLMKFKLFIDKNQEEQVLVYAHQKTKLTEAIEQMVAENTVELNGYKEREVTRLNANEIYCFIVENNRVFALTEKDKFQLRCRLYQLEETLADNFVKINQSCLINIKMISRFDASLSGTLNVKLKNGYNDFVSRRNVKLVKERFGL